MKNRYPGIRPFRLDEKALFFGREEETKELYQIINNARLSVLFAKSGIGKSSILNAGIIPKLVNGAYRVFNIRFQDLEQKPIDIFRFEIRRYAEKVRLVELANDRIAAFKKQTKRAPNLWEELRAYNFEEELGILPVFIFDQFEEFFLHSSSNRQAIIDCLADIANERIPLSLKRKDLEFPLEDEDNDFFDDGEINNNSITYSDDGLDWWRKPLDIKIIIGIRSDKLSLLDDLSDVILDIFNNRYQLLPLNDKKATQAILSPAKSVAYEFSSEQFSYSPNALKEIIQNLSNKKGEIESFQLQIICGHLEEIINKKKLTEITSEYIGGKEGIKQILNDYYENQIASLEKQEQALARRLIEEKLIVNGVRVSLGVLSITAQHNISPQLLSKIEQTRIIKPEETPLGKAYEVSHDTLVGPILKSLKKRQLEEERSAAEKERVRLSNEAIAQRKKAIEELKRRRKITLIASLAILMAILAFIAAVVAWNAQSDLKNTLKDLKTQEQKAVQALEDYIAEEKAKDLLRFKGLKSRVVSILEANLCPKDLLLEMKDIADKYPEIEDLQESIKTYQELQDKNPECK